MGAVRSDQQTHSAPHFNHLGLCVCACDQCTLRLGGAACVCLDCPCDGMGHRGAEHVMVPEFRPYIPPHIPPLSPVAFFPVGRPARPRLPARVPPLVSPSWLALLSSLAPGSSPHLHGGAGHSPACSMSARRMNERSRDSSTANSPPGST